MVEVAGVFNFSASAINLFRSAELKEDDLRFEYGLVDFEMGGVEVLLLGMYMWFEMGAGTSRVLLT